MCSARRPPLVGLIARPPRIQVVSRRCNRRARRRGTGGAVGTCFKKAVNLDLAERMKSTSTVGRPGVSRPWLKSRDETLSQVWTRPLIRGSDTHMHASFFSFFLFPFRFFYNKKTRASFWHRARFHAAPLLLSVSWNDCQPPGCDVVHNSHCQKIEMHVAKEKCTNFYLSGSVFRLQSTQCYRLSLCSSFSFHKKKYALLCGKATSYSCALTQQLLCSIRYNLIFNSFLH